jgi:nicotinamide-nucleotide amidase
MAEGALAHAPVDVAVSVTGIAGPDGGSPDKPVGLVYFAAAPRGRPTLVRECRFGSIGRTAIRLASVRSAMELARQAVSATGRH